MVTKSGTNQFHGNAFEFLENTNLNANSWVNKHTPDPTEIGAVPNLNRNQFGGTLGGPLLEGVFLFRGEFAGAEHALFLTAVAGLPSPKIRPFASLRI